MKIRLSRKLRQMASALLVVMVLGGILCLSVMYYLALIQQQNTLSVRSQAWNIAIAVSEAGIEEGLQALNETRRAGTTLSAAYPACWTFDGTYYWRTNQAASLGDNWYVIRIDRRDANMPEIISQAHVTLPALAANSSSTFFAAAGVSVNPGVITRVVRVRCWDYGLFRAAMVAKHTIDLKGNGVLTDSFDSSNPAKSTNGKYDKNKYQGDFGEVATNDGIIVGVGNANIYGKLHTGPQGGYDLGPQGGVGTHAWQAANGGGMQPDYFLQDANFTFPDTTLPSTAGYLTPQPGDFLVTRYPVTSNSTTAATLPVPLPRGTITTNILSYTTVSAYTNLPGLTTNTTHHSSSWPPSPIPPGLVTNTYSTKSKDSPAPWTYVPPVTYDGKWYHYNAISDYSWQTYTYTYPNFNYTYYLYTTNTVVATNHFDNVLYADQKYVSSALTGSTIVLGPNVTLVLPNGLSGGENLFFNYTDNAKPGLTVYAGGTSASISGNQYINPSGFAGSLLIYCAPTVTSFTLNGNGQFTGVLVAPSADLALNGGGNSEQDFCGSLMVNNVRLNGHFSFHYDEALGNLKNSPRLLVKSWDEIPPAW